MEIPSLYMKKIADMILVKVFELTYASTAWKGYCAPNPYSMKDFQLLALAICLICLMVILMMPS